MRKVGNKDLSIEIKTQVIQFLLSNSIDGRPMWGKIRECSLLFGISVRSINNIWSSAKDKAINGDAVIFNKNARQVPHEKKKPFNKDRYVSIPCKKRTTYRRIAVAMGVSKSQVCNWFKAGLIRAHTNQIKSELTAQNKLIRMKFCLSALRVDRISNTIKFKGMYNTIHIDEKWFYITKACDRFYLEKEESEPYRSCQSKSFITKLMFMCAVARPQYGPTGELLFDGKIGLFPFIHNVEAKRKSKNRPKGTIETKPLPSINQDIIKECLINQVVPAIKAKWPQHASKDIFIQQDNARPHIKDSDEDFRDVASSDGFNIQLVCQPPNSPDLNINDLGWFRAIQSLQEETSSYGVDDLTKNVLDSFDNLTHTKLNNVFISLQNCMVEILKCKGHNNYKLPHMYKERLIREGRLPEVLEVQEELVRESIDYLREDENMAATVFDYGELSSDLGY